ncbi:hypothetical protein NMY22_g5727 [Coprinellus aureogranulatus]|nr:hypothetical protein NMY22_g5727 [Coprinellus aureogranulatus]
MVSFPEEPLNLSATDGFGYYPADINEALNGDQYRIIRKLGWGPRSSTWLVFELDEQQQRKYRAVQIFTASATDNVEQRLLPILQDDTYKFQEWTSFPGLVNSFLEKSIHGDHLCFIINLYGLPFSDVLRDAVNSGRAGLPVRAVQYTTLEIILDLENLHREGVMHGGVKLENLKLHTIDDSTKLSDYLSNNPPFTTETIDGLPVVRLNLSICTRSNGTRLTETSLIGWSCSRGMGTFVNLNSHENPTCGPATDIWMLGCLVFELLTGKPLFNPTDTPNDVQHLLQDPTLEPSPHADPGNVQEQTLETRSKEALEDDEASAAYAFIRKCLVLDPDSRPSAYDLEAETGARPVVLTVHLRPQQSFRAAMTIVHIALPPNQLARTPSVACKVAISKQQSQSGAESRHRTYVVKWSSSRVSSPAHHVSVNARVQRQRS